MRCPGCDGEMEERRLEALYGGEVVLDLCHACHSFWFDLRESLQLAPHSVLQLFKVIHEKQAERPVPLKDAMACPRCGDRLVETHDLQRNTRFSYHRCPKGHGRQTTFFQFLREKNLIKPLDPKQLAELRAQVKTVRCSNCGAPIDLEGRTACDHCRAPISALDPRQVEATLSQLRDHDQKRQAVNPDEVAAKVMMAKMQGEGFYARLEAEQPYRRRGLIGRTSGTFGLVEAGIDALFSLLK